MHCSGYRCGCVCDACKERAASLPRRLTSHKPTQAKIAALLRRDFDYMGRSFGGDHLFDSPTGRTVAIKAETDEQAIAAHAEALGIPCDELTARRLRVRFGSAPQAKDALDGMVAAVRRPELVEVMEAVA